MARMVAPPAAPREAPFSTLVDTHAHLNDPRFAGDVDDVVERAHEAGVSSMIVVGYDLRSSERAIALAHRIPGLWAAVGLHPHHARDFDSQTLAALEQLAGDDRVVAVGECGLDFYRNLSPREQQVDAFTAQITLAQRCGRPVIVHTREAMAETLELLRRQPLDASGVMHCFDGTVADALAAVDLGLYISVAGPITYRKDPMLAQAVAAAPAERLVVETDCPWLSPAGHRGERNEPARVRDVAEAVARVRGESLAEITNRTARNAASLFQRPEVAQAPLEAVA